MSPWGLLLAGVLLILERACYVWIARAPDAFRRACAHPGAWFGEPVAIVRTLFYAFKALQLSVFVGWCYVHGGGELAPTDDPRALAIGTALMVAGQILNLSVFYRLGRVGVFYGDRLGYEVPWCWEFPFSWLSHPQYVGTVLTIWGFFAATRFPHDDWSVLPALETIYYVSSTWLEERGRRAAPVSLSPDLTGRGPGRPAATASPPGGAGSRSSTANCGSIIDPS